MCKDCKCDLHAYLIMHDLNTEGEAILSAPWNGDGLISMGLPSCAGLLSAEPLSRKPKRSNSAAQIVPLCKLPSAFCMA
jgi:hypothetical protein